MTVREIQAHPEEVYGTGVSPTLISTVTDTVMDRVRTKVERELPANCRNPGGVTGHASPRSSTTRRRSER